MINSQPKNYLWSNLKFFLNSHERSGIGWNEIKTKFPISQLSFIWSYCRFCTQNYPNFRWIFTHNSKNKNRRIFLLFFPLYSTNSTSFIKFLKCSPLLSGGGLHILNCDRVKISYRFYLTKKNCPKVAYFSGKMRIPTGGQVALGWEPLV